MEQTPEGFDKTWIPRSSRSPRRFCRPWSKGASPRVLHGSLLGFLLASAPDFVIAFCFPFSIFIRPRAWTAHVSPRLFHCGCVLTLLLLVGLELRNPFGPQIFDRRDIGASILGVCLAPALFHAALRQRLVFGRDPERWRPERTEFH